MRILVGALAICSTHAKTSDLPPANPSTDVKKGDRAIQTGSSWVIPNPFFDCWVSCGARGGKCFTGACGQNGYCCSHRTQHNGQGANRCPQEAVQALHTRWTGVIPSGAATCVRGDCSAGHQWNGANCGDIDECTAGSHNCGSNGVCENTAGSFTCSCKSGFEKIGDNCADIDECAQNNGNCRTNSECKNEAGSFTCLCNDGYSDEDGSCVAEKDAAGDCPTGYEWNVYVRNCVDIDECTDNNGNCRANSECKNEAGSFTCPCNDGYSDEDGSCVAQEKEEPGSSWVIPNPNFDCWVSCGGRGGKCFTGACGQNGYCCSHRTHHNGHGANRCPQEAVQALHTRWTGVIPSGAATCVRGDCSAGYQWNGANCVDIDECADNNGNCRANSECKNEAGSFTCPCNKGYSDEDGSCVAQVKDAAGGLVEMKEAFEKSLHGTFGTEMLFVKLITHPLEKITSRLLKGFKRFSCETETRRRRDTRQRRSEDICSDLFNDIGEMRNWANDNIQECGKNPSKRPKFLTGNINKFKAIQKRIRNKCDTKLKLIAAGKLKV